jgi:hypothetical protein
MITRRGLTIWKAVEALASLVELVLLALLCPLVILLVGLPVALLVRILIEIVRRL